MAKQQIFKKTNSKPGLRLSPEGKTNQEVRRRSFKKPIVDPSKDQIIEKE
jgi:hypothetical protein